MKNWYLDDLGWSFDQVQQRLVPGVCNWCGCVLSPRDTLCYSCHMLGDHWAKKSAYYDGLYISLDEFRGAGWNKYTHHTVDAFDAVRGLRQFRHVSDDDLAQAVVYHMPFLRPPREEGDARCPRYFMPDLIQDLNHRMGITCWACGSVDVEWTAQQWDGWTGSYTIEGCRWNQYHPACQSCQQRVLREAHRTWRKSRTSFNKHVTMAGLRHQANLLKKTARQMRKIT